MSEEALPRIRHLGVRIIRKPIGSGAPTQHLLRRRYPVILLSPQAHPDLIGRGDAVLRNRIGLRLTYDPCASRATAAVIKKRAQWVSVRVRGGLEPL